MAQVTKSLYLKGHDCLRSAWLTEHRPDLKPKESDAQRMRGRTGQRLGEMARSLFDEGRVCWQPGMIQEDALALTQQYRELSVPLFEASFERDGFFARADILEPTPEGWFLWEVKSSTTPKDRHVPDLAFQWLVIESSGWPISGAGVICVDSEWTWPGGQSAFNGLFKREELTPQIRRALDEVRSRLPQVFGALLEAEPPCQARKKVCRDCGFLGHCFPAMPSSDVLFLGHVKDSQLSDWESRGLTSLLDVPDEELTRKDQRDLKRLLAQPGLRLSADLGEELGRIALPACFVDFETDASAIPWLAGSAPYQSIPFQQASVLIESWEEPPGRVDFLWNPGQSPDPRPDFIQSLLPGFRQAASIIHYSNAEIVQLRKLREQGVPGSGEALDLILAKGVDLERIVKGRVQHPDLGTKTTIKKVLPLLCPELADAYGSMEISDGDAAMAAFQRLRSGRLVREESERLISALISYCHLDSSAMAAVAQALRRLTAQGI